MFTFPYTKAGAEDPKTGYYDFLSTIPVGIEDYEGTYLLSFQPSNIVTVDWNSNSGDYFPDGVWKYLCFALPKSNPAFSQYLYFTDWLSYSQNPLGDIWDTVSSYFDVTSVTFDGSEYWFYVSKIKTHNIDLVFKIV